MANGNTRRNIFLVLQNRVRVSTSLCFIDYFAVDFFYLFPFHLSAVFFFPILFRFVHLLVQKLLIICSMT